MPGPHDSPADLPAPARRAGFARSGAIAGLLALGGLLPPAAVNGQAITGRVVDRTDDSPVAAARVAVLDEAGAVVAAADTDDEGRFALSDVPAGRLTVRVDALGYTATAAEPLDHDGGAVVIEVGVERAPMEAEGIRIRVRPRSSRFRSARQMIAGRVLDARTGAPVAGMDLVVRNVRDRPVGRTLSDEDGRFWASVEGAGLYRVAVSGFGYDSTAAADLAVSPGQDLYVELNVQPRAFGVEPITVTAPRVIPFLEGSGFYERRRRGHGTFFGPRDIDRFPGAFPTQLLRRVPGISVTRGQIQIRGALTMTGGPCRPRIYLDGIQLGGESLDDLVPMTHVDAIEVYRGAATVPPQWRGHATCGVIAVWTRH